MSYSSLFKLHKLAVFQPKTPCNFPTGTTKRIVGTKGNRFHMNDAALDVANLSLAQSRLSQRHPLPGFLGKHSDRAMHISRTIGSSVFPTRRVFVDAVVYDGFRAPFAIQLCHLRSRRLHYRALSGYVMLYRLLQSAVLRVCMCRDKHRDRSCYEG